MTLIGKKGHRYGTIEARDEREATAKAAEEFQIPPERSLSPSLPTKSSPAEAELSEYLH